MFFFYFDGSESKTHFNGIYSTTYTDKRLKYFFDDSITLALGDYNPERSSYIIVVLAALVVYISLVLVLDRIFM